MGTPAYMAPEQARHAWTKSMPAPTFGGGRHHVQVAHRSRGPRSRHDQRATPGGDDGPRPPHRVAAPHGAHPGGRGGRQGARLLANRSLDRRAHYQQAVRGPTKRSLGIASVGPPLVHGCRRPSPRPTPTPSPRRPRCSRRCLWRAIPSLIRPRKRRRWLALVALGLLGGMEYFAIRAVGSAGTLRCSVYHGGISLVNAPVNAASHRTSSFRMLPSRPRPRSFQWRPVASKPHSLP